MKTKLRYYFRKNEAWVQVLNRFQGKFTTNLWKLIVFGQIIQKQTWVLLTICTQRSNLCPPINEAECNLGKVNLMQWSVAFSSSIHNLLPIIWVSCFPLWLLSWPVSRSLSCLDFATKKLRITLPKFECSSAKVWNIHGQGNCYIGRISLNEDLTLQRLFPSFPGMRLENHTSWLIKIIHQGSRSDLLNTDWLCMPSTLTQ